MVQVEGYIIGFLGFRVQVVKVLLAGLFGLGVYGVDCCLRPPKP